MLFFNYLKKYIFKIINSYLSLIGEYQVKYTTLNILQNIRLEKPYTAPIVLV